MSGIEVGNVSSDTLWGLGVDVTGMLPETMTIDGHAYEIWKPQTVDIGTGAVVEAEVVEAELEISEAEMLGDAFPGEVVEAGLEMSEVGRLGDIFAGGLDVANDNGVVSELDSGIFELPVGLVVV